jgi:uncharacterized membrane protein HdeD (DUF308 family)
LTLAAAFWALARERLRAAVNTYFFGMYELTSGIIKVIFKVQ